MLDLPAQSCIVLSWGYSSSRVHQKGEQSRPFCAGAASASVLLLHTLAPHPQPTVPTGGHLASERDRAGQEGSREAGRWPARRTVVHKDSAFPSRPLATGIC